MNSNFFLRRLACLGLLGGTLHLAAPAQGHKDIVDYVNPIIGASTSDQDGGWGNGDGKVNYTVYFHCRLSKPMKQYGVWLHAPGHLAHTGVCLY